MIDRLFTHSANVTRNTAAIVTASTLPISVGLTLTYNVPVVVEVSIPDGYGVFRITGTLAGATQTSDVTFTNGETIKKRVSTKAFNTITNFSSVSGTATNATAIIQGKTGQPILTEAAVLTAIRCRFDSDMPGGNPFFSQAGLLRPDELFCFVNTTEDAILVDDIVTDVASSKRYQVKDVNPFYNNSRYIYTKLKLIKL